MAVTKLVAVAIVLFLQGTYSEAGRYRDGLDYLGRCSGGRRRDFLDDLASEIKRGYWGDFDMHAWLRSLRGMSDAHLEDAISRLLDKLDARYPKEVEELLRKKIRDWKMKEPMRYVAYYGFWNREQAEAKCKKEGKRLAVIRTPIEQSLAWEEAYVKGVRNVYIGLHMKIERGREKYYWYDKTDFTYGNMKPWQWSYGPRCFVLNVNKGWWVMKKCKLGFSVLCEYAPKPATSTKVTPSPAPPKPAVTTRKPVTDSSLGYSGYDAVRACRSQGRRVAIIRSWYEQMQVQTVARTAMSAYVYLGLYYYPDGRKLWIDNSKVTFSNFGMQTAALPTKKRCYVMQVRTGFWYHIDCSYKYPVICQTFTLTTQRPPTRTTKSPGRVYTTAVPDMTPKRPTRVETTAAPAEPEEPTTIATTRNFVDTKIRMKVDYQAALTDKDFREKMKYVVAKALKISTDYLVITNLEPGSTIVSLRIFVPEEESKRLTASKVHSILTTAAAKGELNVEMEEKVVSPFADGVKTNKEPEPDEEDEDKSKTLKILSGVFTILVILTAVVVFLLLGVWLVRKKRRLMRGQNEREQRFEDLEPKCSKECADNEGYEHPPPDKDAPPRYSECAQETKA